MELKKHHQDEKTEMKTSKCEKEATSTTALIIIKLTILYFHTYCYR